MPHAHGYQSPGQHSPCQMDVKIVMCSEKHKHWHEFTAKLDTQTPDNWISAAVAASLGVRAETVPASSYTTFSGETVTSSKIIKRVRWGAVDVDCGSRAMDFRLAPANAPFEVVLGSDFIGSNEIVTVNPANLILAKKKETKGSSLNILDGRGALHS